MHGKEHSKVESLQLNISKSNHDFSMPELYEFVIISFHFKSFKISCSIARFDELIKQSTPIILCAKILDQFQFLK